MSKSMSREMVRLIGTANKKGTSAYDTQGQVIRIEGDTAWVHIPGGIDETPVRLTMNAKAGDTVQVRVSGGRAWLTGNASSPPTDDTQANKARDTAAEAMAQALASEQEAERAKLAADNAEASAKTAHEKAVEAGKSAAEAKESADEAKTSAGAANKAANNALSQLSVVEDVVGTLTWISEHGDYALTEDTEVAAGKYYFTKNADSFNVVISPQGNPAEQGWYELISVDEAVSNYVASHLALTDAGLWVVNDNRSYRILLSGDGMKVYDAEGNLVASFGESIRFSSSRPQYIGGEDAYIVFYDSNGNGVPDAINIGGSKVTILGNKKLSDLLTNLDISTRQTDDGAEITVGDKTVSLKDGEDSVLLRIDSSRGNVFKNSQVSTVMTVTIIKAGESITDAVRMREVFGTSSYLQWKWKHISEDDFHIIVNTDSMISDEGFTLTLTPERVDTKVTFMCELNY